MKNFGILVEQVAALVDAIHIELSGILNGSSVDIDSQTVKILEKISKIEDIDRPAYSIERVAHEVYDEFDCDDYDTSELAAEALKWFYASKVKEAKPEKRKPGRPRTK